MIRAMIALLLLAACERTVTTTHVVNREDGTGGTATTVEARAPDRDFGMVDADGTDSGEGFNR